VILQKREKIGALLPAFSESLALGPGARRSTLSGLATLVEHPREPRLFVSRGALVRRERLSSITRLDTFLPREEEARDEAAAMSGSEQACLSFSLEISSVLGSNGQIRFHCRRRGELSSIRCF